jgi:DNA-binding MarR family transcriptional regulator
LHYQSLTLKLSPPPEIPIGLLASRVAQSVRHLVASHAEPLGISTQQFWTVVAVAENAVPSQADLAARLRVDEATACRAVRALGEAGLVSSARDPDDRRRVRLELAPAGEALARRLLPLAHRIRGAIDASLTPEERATTRLALTKVIARLATLIDEGPAGPRPPEREPAGAAKRRPPAAPPPAPARARSRSRKSLNGKERGRP